MTSTHRLRLCSLARLDRMHEALCREIDRLKQEVSELEDECVTMATDEDSVLLSEFHGNYQLEIDRVEELIDATERKIEVLREKRELIEEVRQCRQLRDEQVRLLGSEARVTLK
ncbi:MAG: hypothetical protein MK312_15415, partial [Roseibacillus sp.]|nr:hypothetical protein [Roseibacillus sp.]